MGQQVAIHNIIHLFPDQDGTYDCSSSSTLTFCFARSSRSNLRQPSNPSKLHRHRYSPPVSAAAEV